MVLFEFLAKAIRGGGPPIEDVRVKYAIYCAVMLTTLSVLDQADKWALPTLQISGLQCSSCGGADESFTEKCQSECLDITDSQMGFLLGPAFSITSVFASLPLGYLADRRKRVRILLIGMIVWSTATLLSSFCQTFYQLAIFRMILGIGAAAVNPTAFSLLSDYFHPKFRSTVMSAFQSTVYLGQDIGLLSGIISQNTSWRFVFFLLGIPGIIIAIPFYLTVWEPKRGRSETQTEVQTSSEQNTQEEAESKKEIESSNQKTQEEIEKEEEMNTITNKKGTGLYEVIF